VTAGAAHQLPGVDRRRRDDLGDPRVGVVEGLAKYVRRALGGGELLEQDEHRVLQGLALLGPESGVVVGVDRFREPRTDVGLAPRVRGLQGVDGEPGGDRREEGGGFADVGAIGVLPADPGLLHHVLGIRDGAEHPVGDAEESPPVCIEDGDRVVQLGDRLLLHAAPPFVVIVRAPSRTHLSPAATGQRSDP
jgi:hypothetical protein